MTSQIQSDAIDVEFPVAGQDNDSQGFRDNFSVIQNALATANSEITDLQTNAARLDVDNDFNGTVIGNAQTNRLYGTVFNLTTSSGTNLIDYEQGELYTVSLTGNHSLRFSNWPEGKNQTDVYAKVKVLIKNGTAPITAGNFVIGKKYDITDAGTTDWVAIGAANGSVGTQFTATGVGSGTGTAVEVLTVTFIDVVITGSGTSSYEVGSKALAVEGWTSDRQYVYLSLLGDFSASNTFTINSINEIGDVSAGGATLNQVLKFDGTNWVAEDIAWNGEERVLDASTADLTKTAGYFITGAVAEGAVLGAGTAGQVKVFAMDTKGGGNMVINVTNPGWVGAGTITFTAVGQACTLQYINSKWFCVGNNGATFA